MSFLTDLLNKARSNLGNNLDVIGSYAGLPETGISEWVAGGPTANSQNWINSAAADGGNTAYEAPYNVGSQLGPGNYPGALEFRNQTSGGTPPPTNDSTGGGGNNGGGAGGGGTYDGGLSQQIALAKAAAQEGFRRAQAAFDRARGIYDEGIGLLGKRRGEFKDIYDTGNNDILTSYEGERGNLQATNQGSSERLRNSLRALGLGGSAFLKGTGKLAQEGARAAGNLSTQKQYNERENLRGYNTNLDFANQQEASLNRFLSDADEARRSTEAQIGLAQQGDVNQINSNVNSLLNSIYSQQNALAAAGQGIGAYQANPYAVNIPSMLGALNGAVSTFGVGGGNGAGQNEAVSLAPESQSYLDLLKQRAGGNLYA